MTNRDFLERAFALADSGTVHSIQDMRGALLSEGYSHQEIGQLSGLVLTWQLLARIKAAAAMARRA